MMSSLGALTSAPAALIDATFRGKRGGREEARHRRRIIEKCSLHIAGRLRPRGGRACKRKQALGRCAISRHRRGGHEPLLNGRELDHVFHVLLDVLGLLESLRELGLAICLALLLRLLRLDAKSKPVEQVARA